VATIPTGDLARPRIGMPVFDALTASILRCQQAGGARATDDRQRQLFAALEPGNTQIIRFGVASGYRLGN